MKAATTLLIGVCLAVLVVAAPVPTPEISSTCTSHSFCWSLETNKNGTCVKEKECNFQSSCQCNMGSLNVANDENGQHYGPVDEKEKELKTTGYDTDNLVHD